jgi:hypothetical protein
MPPTTIMLHPSKGVVIHLNKDQSSNESHGGGHPVGLQPPQFKDVPDGAVLILYRQKFESPNLESLQKIFHNFINHPACNYFKRKSSQATAFQNIQAACKIGWKMEALR